MTLSAQTTTPTTEQNIGMLIEQIKDALDAFEETQRTWRSHGANDTEPDGIFQQLIHAAAHGEGPAIPRTGHGWELYAHSMDCAEAAAALHDSALNVVRLIESCPVRDLAQMQQVIKDYCWRLR